MRAGDSEIQGGHMNLQGRQACLRGRRRTADLIDVFCSPSRAVLVQDFMRWPVHAPVWQLVRFSMLHLKMTLAFQGKPELFAVLAAGF